jgi:hypothetical protein
MLKISMYAVNCHPYRRSIVTAPILASILFSTFVPVAFAHVITTIFENSTGY